MDNVQKFIKAVNILKADTEMSFDGTGVRDYIHIMDLAKGHISTLEHLFNNSSKFINLNLGTGRGTSVLELINTFEKVNNIKVPYSFSSRRNGDTDSLIADNTLALKTLNWVPTNSIEQMCKDGWIWQKSFK